MLRTAFGSLRARKHLVAIAAYFIVFSFIYYLLDRLNGGYAAMASAHGAFLVVLNVVLNVAMAATSALMMGLSTVYFTLSGKEGKGTFFGSLAVFFGMLTYGCTSCVVALFATIGITLSVAVLPYAGLPYKLLAAAILALGFVWLLLEIKHGKCKIKNAPDPADAP